MKLEKFKKRLETDNVVAFFKSPADLRAHVINSLAKLRERKETEFHFVSDIPKPPAILVSRNECRSTLRPNPEGMSECCHG